ncbi:MAG: aspartate carbamoyltransferase regulatory subunit [Mycoplasmoidaceae bacterium]
MNKLKLSSIKNGVVIDHIKNYSTKNIFNMLNIEKLGVASSMALNLNSSKLGMKGIIKIESKILTPEEINKISFLSPDCTINLIENYLVVKKIIPETPRESKNILKCKNTNCISNNERSIYTSFLHFSKDNDYYAQCYFCERTYQLSILRLKNEIN